MKHGILLKHGGCTRIEKQRTVFDLALKKLRQAERCEDYHRLLKGMSKSEATRQPQAYESQLEQQARAQYYTLTQGRAGHGAPA